ncbi:hypothetical protein GCM10023314_13470 [Algibacter agarivorans]|uniref:Uncharacterized protein n=1 Tax=Algibacter agarivorans TaxID=1109741 RepID=A0ABP9GFQ1_9FLAO
MLFKVKLFLLTIKSKSKIDAYATKSNVVCFTINAIGNGSFIKLNLAITKAKSVIKKTMMKFIGLDLLKILVIINCFCIFAT